MTTMRVENDLKPHNEETIKRILEFYKTSNKCCAIQATGTGKTFLILRLLEIYNDMDKSAVIFAPNREIISQTKKRMKKFGLNNATFYTYQKLARMTDEEIENINADLIVCDELHRTGAKTWGQKFEVLVETHSDSKVFGVTATPLRCADGRDMSEEYFDGNKACDISLAEALVRKIIPVMPVYVSALYTFEEEYKNMSDKIENGRNSDEEKAELMKELKAAKQQLEKSNGIPEIIKKYITNYNGKYIVFCKDKRHLYAMKDVVIQWFRDAGYNGKIFDYPYYSNNNEVKRNLTNFENNEEDGLKLLFVIDKLNEGLHLDVVHGCILLRTTTSNIIYYQQIGRAIDAGCDQKRVILDLVSNFNSLKTFNLKKELDEKIIERQNGKFTDCSEEFDVEEFHVNDYVQECIDVFNNIDEMIIGDSWTKEEDNIIKGNYPKFGIGMTYLLPNRTERAIYHRAIRLKIGKDDTKEVTDWNEEEIEKLKFLYPKLSRKCFDQFGNKTIKMLEEKVSELGLLSDIYWSDEDIEILKEKYPLMGSKCSVYFKDKNQLQTKQKACKLNIKYIGFQEWTDEEVNILKTYYPIIGSKCIKYLPNRKESVIRNKAFQLNLIVKKNTRKSKYKYVHWNKKNQNWNVSFVVDKEQLYFGSYDSEDEAGKVAMEKAKEYGKV